MKKKSILISSILIIIDLKIFLTLNINKVPVKDILKAIYYADTQVIMFQNLSQLLKIFPLFSLNYSQLSIYRIRVSRNIKNNIYITSCLFITKCCDSIPEPQPIIFRSVSTPPLPQNSNEMSDTADCLQSRLKVMSRQSESDEER